MKSVTTTLALRTGAEVRAAVRIGEGGERPKCLLLHGNPGRLEDWQELWPSISSTADVVAIDLPGFGSSSRPDPSPGCLRLERLAEHALAVADALSWREPIYWVGHSHGGGVAQLVAARSPERVAGLVLVGTLGTPAHPSYRLLATPGAESLARMAGAFLRVPGLRSLSRVVLRRVMRDIFFPERVPDEEVESELSLFSERPEILVAMVHVALGRPCELLLESASRIRCRTLFLHGADDALVPWQNARAVHERIVGAGGHSEWETIPGAGHMLVRYQAPELARRIRRMTSTRGASANGSV
jgi:pimeloyl-ACP methyl ester carboxylesterase